MFSRLPITIPTSVWAFRRVVVVLIGATLLASAGARFSHDAALGEESLTGRNETTLPSVGALVPDDSLDQRILYLELTGQEWDASVEDLDLALFGHEDAQRRVAQAQSDLVETVAERRLVATELRDAELLADTVDQQIQLLESLLQDRAISLFVNFGDDETEALSSVQAAADGARVRQLANEVDESQLDERDRLTAQQADLGRTLSAFRGRLIELSTTEGALRLAIDAARTDLVYFQAQIGAATQAVRDARHGARIAGYDFSITALDAYLGAESLLADVRPSCHAEWWMIAGIARVESRHGELAGRSILRSGRTSTEIIGVALDGRPGVRAIVDTDDGNLDGDRVWDRAVGPMQFIPETWKTRGRDATGDGIADPHNLYDAAFTTGRYLCQLGGDLSLDANLLDAYFGYNTSPSYVSKVKAYASQYRDLQFENAAANE